MTILSSLSHSVHHMNFWIDHDKHTLEVLTVNCYYVKIHFSEVLWSLIAWDETWHLSIWFITKHDSILVRLQSIQCCGIIFTLPWQMESAFGKDCVQVCRLAAGGILCCLLQAKLLYLKTAHFRWRRNHHLCFQNGNIEFNLLCVKKSLPCPETIIEERCKA